MTSFAIGTRHLALCADGVTRSAMVTNYADTFFSVPAQVKVKGKTVTGSLYHVGIGENEKLQFSPDAWRKNAALLPNWPERCRTCFGRGKRTVYDENGAFLDVMCHDCRGEKEKVYPREVTSE